MFLRSQRIRLACALLLLALAVPAGAYYPQWAKKSLVPMTNPSSIAAADLNGDGRPEVVMRVGNSVYVSFPAADGTLTTPESIYAASTLTDLIAADADNNGTVDVIVSNITSNTVTVLPGVGNGTFGTPIVTSLTVSPSSIAAADFNGDGKLDLAYRSYPASWIGVLTGDGGGQFSQVSTFPIGAQTTQLEAGDVDHDGMVDLVLAFWDTTPYKLFFGRGDGTFEPGVDLPTPGAESRALVLADLDADNDLEILVCNFNANTLTVILNNGSRTFAGAAVYSIVGGYRPPSTNPADIVVGELDGREGMDVLVTATNARSLVTLSGNGDGTLSSPIFEPGIFGPSTDLLRYMALADFTGDGRLDVAVAGSASIGMYVNRAGDTNVFLTSQHPTITAGQTARFVIRVRSPFDEAVSGHIPIPQGTITLRSGGTEIGSGTLNRADAVIEVAALPVGTHAITAEYSGDDNFHPTTSSDVTQRVVSESTTTTLTRTGASSVAYGTPVTLTANVTSPLDEPLNGGLFLYENGVRSQYSQSGPAPSWSLHREPGTYEFYATFEGTATQPPSTSNVLTQIVSKAPTTTTINGSAHVKYSQQPSYGFEVIVSSPSGSSVAGMVKLYDGDVLIETIQVGQRANPALPVGVHHLRAVYEGDSRHESSRTEFFEYTVLPDDPFVLVAFANGTTINVKIFDSNSSVLYYYRYYRYYRRIGTGQWDWFKSFDTQRVETGAQAGVAYVYRAEKYDGNTNQLVATSNIDAAIVGSFTDHPLVAGVTAKAVHPAELLSAANTLLAVSASSPIALDGAVPGGAIRAEHVLALRNAINNARIGAGMAAAPWTDIIAPGVAIRASHIMELRNALR